ncbi:ABC transporter permease [Acidisoma silvae]|uniref:ABC transporter permease n=1 Tax=Acidisoma silvae TaxID=2802396 RepID=A0A963YW88_9PROT|nr:ABC transporter permease [Acidisoma silvae]MCB8878362.1 ABC transporter permease [Acidisoma silvae]
MAQSVNISTRGKDGAALPPDRERPSAGQLLGGLFGSTTSAIAVILVVICILLSLLSDSFLTANNIYAILSQSSVVGITAVGGTFVVITGGIDLSVGAAIGLAGMIGALFMQAGFGAVGGTILTMLVAMAVGAINGISVAGIKLAPFIVTLATMGMAQGLTLEANGGQSVYSLPAVFTYFGSGTVLGGIPISVIVTVIVFAAGGLLLTKTAFGKSVFAVGGNREAARLAGIRVNLVTFLVYVIAGICVGIASVIIVGRVGAATPTGGVGVELRVIAAIVIGGTSLFGGKGSLWGTLVGVLLIGVINNGLTLLNVDPFLVQFMQSALIFVAVLFDAVNTRRITRGRLKMPRKS